MARSGRPANPFSKLKSEAAHEGDERVGSWAREQLVEMDQRFVERVERHWARPGAAGRRKRG